jgi:hypothetical protein
MISQKIDALEHYMTPGGDGGHWTDNREIMMLGGIKADLLGLGLG